MNYICLLPSFRVCGAVLPVPHMSSKCVVLFLQSLTCLQSVWCSSFSPSCVFEVCDTVLPVPHMSSKCLVLFLQSFTCLQSVWCCSFTPSHVFKVCGAVPSVLHISSKCLVLFLQSFTCLQSVWCLIKYYDNFNEIFTSCMAFQYYCVTDTHKIWSFHSKFVEDLVVLWHYAVLLL
jgi:hypothetical protein